MNMYQGKYYYARIDFAFKNAVVTYKYVSMLLLSVNYLLLLVGNKMQQCC